MGMPTIKVDSGWIGTCLSLLAAGAPVMWPDAGRTIGPILFGLAALVFVLGIRIEGFHLRWIKREHMVPLIGMVIFGAGFIVCAAWYFLPKATTAPQVEAGVDNKDHPPIDTQKQLEVGDKDRPSVLKLQRVVNPNDGLLSYSIANSVVDGKPAAVVHETRNKEKLAKSNSKQMPNVLSMFVHDSAHVDGIAFNGYWDLKSNDANDNLRAFYYVFNDTKSNSRYVAIYIPQHKRYVEAIAYFAQNYAKLIENLDKQFEAVYKVEGQIGEESSWDMVFSGLVIIYTEEQPKMQQSAELMKIFKQYGATAQFRSIEYVLGAWKNINLGKGAPIDLYELRGTPPLIQGVLSQK
jgi:hypothetical protein